MELGQLVILDKNLMQNALLSYLSFQDKNYNFVTLKTLLTEMSSIVNTAIETSVADLINNGRIEIFVENGGVFIYTGAKQE